MRERKIAWTRFKRRTLDRGAAELADKSFRVTWSQHTPRVSPAMNLSTSQRDMHNSTFGTQGMSTSTSGSNPNPWGHSTSSNAYGSLSDSLNQSLTQARPQYQAGYLMVRVFLLSSVVEKLTGHCSLQALQMYIRPRPSSQRAAS